MDKSVGESIKAFGFEKVLSYLDADPEKNIVKLVDWLIKVDTDGKHVAPQAVKAKRWLEDKDSNWYQLVKSLYTDIDDRVRKSFLKTCW